VEDRAVLNIGGIANFTLLPAGGQVSGFDTGPGNALLDAWIERYQGQALDRNGAWAASGTPSQSLLKALMADPYFHLNPPKSTGREYFHLGWLTSHLAGFERLAPEDVQATLLQLTAHSICMALKAVQPSTRRVLVCGGGVHNRALMRALQGRMPKIMWSPTDEFGLDADWVEAVAFAWLARRTLQGLDGNLPAVTGAREAVILGGIYPAGPG
jgi:anhydro-N-acetylmuramic acid kinase